MKTSVTGDDMTYKHRCTSAVATAVLLAACGAPTAANNSSADTDSQTAALMAPDAGAEPGIANPATGETAAVVETQAGPMQVMLVMDSSGSMWGQIDGTSKRDIARKAVREMIDRNPALNAAGLMAYGHRRTGDCADIELVRMPGADVPLPDAVDRLSPVGKTPLSAAVRQAADAMNIREERATVILVTDGVETCDLDPCATGTELEASGIDFTAHVVGFGLSEQEGRQVACLAELTGGRYFAAANASELAAALETVSEVVDEVPPEAATATASIKGPPEAEIGAAIGVTWIGPGGTSDYIDLVPAGYDRTSGELSYSYLREDDKVSMRAPGKPGDYMLRYVWIAPQGRTVIATAPIRVTDAAIALIAPARIKIGGTLNVTWKGPGNSGDYVDLVPRGYTKTSGEISFDYIEQKGEALQIKAPGTPGAYDLRYVAEASDGRRVLKVVPLEVTDASVDLAFNPSAVLGEKLVVDWSGPGTDGDYIDLVPGGYTKTSGELSYAYTDSGNPAELSLPGEPGEYQVRYVLESPDGRTILKTVPLILKDAEFSVAPASASATAGSTIKVAWTGPAGSQDYIDIVPRGDTRTSGELSYVYVQPGQSPAELRLPGKPGDYDVRYVFEASTGRTSRAVAPLKVTPAKISLNSPASIAAGAEIEVSWSGSGGRDDYLDIVPAGHTDTHGELSFAYVREGTKLTLKAPDKKGDYLVRYILEAPDGREVLTTKPLKVN